MYRRTILLRALTVPECEYRRIAMVHSSEFLFLGSNRVIMNTRCVAKIHGISNILLVLVDQHG